MPQTIEIVKTVPITNIIIDLEKLLSEICNNTGLALADENFPALTISGSPSSSLLDAATLDGKLPSYYDITLHNINDLMDVDTTGVSDGYILMWNDLDMKWKAVESISNLDDILNVQITNPSNKEILIYEYDTGNWINSTLNTAGIAPANHLHDDRYLRITGGSITGNLIVSNNLTVNGGLTAAYNFRVTGTAKESGYFYAGATAPTNTTRLNYDGYLYATRVYNAIYNDYAECFYSDGLIYSEVVNRIVEVDFDGKLSLAKEKSDGVIGIVSDSYGFLLNSSEEEIENGSKIPVGLAGTLYVDSEDIVDERNIHRLICAGKDGKARVIPKGKAHKYEGCVVGKIIGVNKEKNQYKIIISLR